MPASCVGRGEGHACACRHPVVLTPHRQPAGPWRGGRGSSTVSAGTSTVSRAFSKGRVVGRAGRQVGYLRDRLDRGPGQPEQVYLLEKDRQEGQGPGPAREVTQQRTTVEPRTMHQEQSRHLVPAGRHESTPLAVAGPAVDDYRAQD